ncbi:hypothetical protein J2Y41_004660 [Arthrobacter sp. 1088]|uniref:hypothetical protein n=1 Tax=Arthrobacter sp. 1088 TaxID=2817768 RepID=UPI00285B0079|nr:hypothetical protein [Arthrobacter sp. 1088]MDR6689056.1 hypothetical protein [Arthrobacter sp. 1088]
MTTELPGNAGSQARIEPAVHIPTTIENAPFDHSAEAIGNAEESDSSKSRQGDEVKDAFDTEGDTPE